jgi:hypothetical protein
MVLPHALGSRQGRVGHIATFHLEERQLVHRHFFDIARLYDQV